MHVDTGHNFPEVIEFRDRRVAELGERLIVASVQDSIDSGRVRRGDRPARVAQPPADDDAARRDRGARLRRRVRRRAPRRGARPGEGAHLLLPRRLRRLGPEEPAPGAVEPLQRPHPPRRERARVPDLQLDRARRLAVHRRRRSSRCPSIYFAHEREVFERDGMLYADLRPRVELHRRRGAVHDLGALPHRRRHELHRRRRVDRRRPRPTSSPRSPRRGSPSAARRAPTTASPRPRWRTARSRATSSEPRSPATSCASRPPAPSTTASRR